MYFQYFGSFGGSAMTPALDRGSAVGAS